jgi:hypothetical protein
LNVTITITGTAPLLMHNSTLANPLHPLTKSLKKITSKPSQRWVDEDHIAKYRIQFEGALYHDSEQGPYMPGTNIAKALQEGAGLIVRGMGAKVKRGVFLVSPINPLRYDGPRDITGLFNDQRFQRVLPVNGNPSASKKSTVMSCRPVFLNWSCTATALINPATIGLDDLEKAIKAAGQMVGLGDWRPWHGRFDATVEG